MILKKCIIDTITITHFFLIIDTITITLKKNNSRYNYKYTIFLVDTS